MEAAVFSYDQGVELSVGDWLLVNGQVGLVSQVGPGRVTIVMMDGNYWLDPVMVENTKRVPMSRLMTIPHVRVERLTKQRALDIMQARMN